MRKHQAGLIDGKAWCARLLRALALVAAVFSQLDAGYAQQSAPELPTEPILRIEAGQHVAQIQRIDTDAANKFAVTASWDKTVRVWSLPDGKLQRVLRLPIDYGSIGKAYAVAISPDASTIAVGGWTGPPGHNNIFLFDRASGALKQRLSDLPDVINHLAYSADGRRLAASLGSNGIRVFDALNGYQLLPSDTQYGDAAIGRSLTEPADWSQRHTMGSSDCMRPTNTLHPLPGLNGRAIGPTRPLFLPTALASPLETMIATTWWFCRVRT